jgi:nitrite reductase/ring-hydroxylating ferredoxin subunit
MTRNWRTLPRTGHSRYENLVSQPLKFEGLFANPDAIVEGWYPLLPSNLLAIGEARSFTILRQRVVVWRGQDANLSALDAFCPHMGADLGNGRVVGNNLQCYFHHWQFSSDGQVSNAVCSRMNSVEKARLKRYELREYLGHVWIYAGDEIRTPLIVPAGLEDHEIAAMKIAEPTLFAHHHVMMAGGIDLLHFSTVHGIDIDFDFQHSASADSVLDWSMSGPIANTTWRGRVGRLLVGSEFKYRLRVGGGSMVAITYGENQRFMGRFFKIPSLHVLWGCVPTTDGVSRVTVFSVIKKPKGWLAGLRARALHALTLALLVWLRDDDVKAFPNMRFQVATPLPEDKPVLQLIFAINRMRESIWTKKSFEEKSKNSHLSTGSSITN